MNKLHVIYIPGLGDHNVELQQKAVQTWRWWGVSSELFSIGWSDGKWEPKFLKLLEQIDARTAAGYSVALVGASAGASAAINAYANRKNTIIGVVLIAGKINHPERIGARLRQTNPAFVISANHVSASLSQLDQAHRSRILSRYAIADPIVPAEDSRINGARNRRVPTAGHVVTIATQITLGAPSFIYFLKRLMKS